MGGRRLWVPLCAMVLLLASCTSSGSHKAKGSSSGTATVGWTRLDLTPVSQPFTAAGNFIVYISVAGGLGVVALNPTTGKTVWQATATPSAITPGEGPELGVYGNIVTFLEPSASVTAFQQTAFEQTGNNQSATVVGVNAATGAVMWRSPPGLFSDWPLPCIDDPTVVCATGLEDGTGASQLLRFNSADGTSLVPVTIAASDLARALGPDLFDPGTRSPEQLLAVNGSTVVWKHPLASVFPESGYSSDNGWDFDRIGSVGLFVGSVNGGPVTSNNFEDVVNLADSATAGFSIATGAVTWRQPGTQYVCNFLPCPGSATISSGTPAYSPPTMGLRLRETGMATFEGSSAPTLSQGAKIMIEGFDLATGHTLWSVDAGADVDLAQATALPQVAQEVVILPDTTGAPKRLNLVTGVQSAIPTGTVAFCQASTTYTGPGYPDAQGQSNTDYSGDAVEFPCMPNGESTSVPAKVPTFVGPSLGGVVAWSESSEIVAAPPAG
jgi:PQQ-like domain